MSETGSDDFWGEQLRKHVEARRQRTGHKFETCERMKPTFAALDATGWNDWPPQEHSDNLTRKASSGRWKGPNDL